MALEETSKPVIVSGADANFARTLWQLLRSAERHGVDKSFHWIVYDLGLSLSQRDKLSRFFPWINLRSFDFAAYPSHVAMERQTYAWKPIIIDEVLDEYDVPVLWLDAGTVLTSNLQEALSIARKNGVMSLKGQARLGDHCDPRTFKALSGTAELLHKPERAGGFIGFNPRHIMARAIARNWSRHAMVEEHIAPTEALPKHKYDQAIISILLYQAEMNGLLALDDHEIDISSMRPMRWATTRNKVARWVPRFADPAVRAYYFLWKSADQLQYRLKDWERRWIGGTERRYREHFTTSVQQAHKAPKPLNSPAGGYYADPFPIRWRGEAYVLVEEYIYKRSSGRLLCLSLNADLDIIASDEIIPATHHLSFPFMLEHKGQLMMVPESHENQAIDLYVAGATPKEWRMKRRLVYGIDAADTVVFRLHERWWLFTSVLKPGASNRHLEIYFTEDLLSGEFKPHPINAAHLYADQKFGTGRNGGNFIKVAGGWVRPMQNSPEYYGQGLKQMLITTLDTENFAEEPYQGMSLYSDVTETLSPHHIAGHSDLLAWDVRDRVR